VIRTVLHCETNSRPRSKTLHVRLSIPTVKFLGTLRQDNACGGDKFGDAQPSSRAGGRHAKRKIEDRVARSVAIEMSIRGEIVQEGIILIGSDSSRFSRGSLMY